MTSDVSQRAGRLQGAIQPASRTVLAGQVEV